MAKSKDSKKPNICKLCNAEFLHPDKRQVFCSKECLARRKELTRVETTCCVCGKSIVKRRSMIRDKNCCGLDCQRIWAGRCGSKLEPYEKSKKAKEHWRKLRQRERKKRLFAVVKSKLHELEFKRKEAYVDPWAYALRTRLGGNKHRKSVRPVTIKPSRTIEQALKKIGNRRKWFEKSDWEKKVNNRLSNQSARRNRKHVAKLARRSGDEEDRGVWVQVCFDWMANHTE